MSSILGVSAALLLIGAAACLVHLHRVADGVDPLADAVSDYGAGEHAAWYRAQVSLVGIAALCVASGLSAAALDAAGLWWLVAFGASRICIAWFPVDLPGRTRTRTGRIHNLLAATAFASIAVAASGLGRVLDDISGWGVADWLRPLGTFVAAISVALGVTWLLPTLRRSFFGLVERCWYAAMLLWLVLASVGLALG